MSPRATPLSIRRVPLDNGASDNGASPLALASLALAAQAWPENDRAGQLAALADLVQSGERDRLILLAGYRGQQLCGAVLAQVLTGRAAVVWPPQLAKDCSQNEGGNAAARALLDEVQRQLAVAGVRLAQAVLDQDTAGDSACTLQSAGFVPAGELTYMAAEAASFPVAPPPLAFRLESAAAISQEQLVRAVEATYRGSLDCPLVDGLRPATDVLSGYQAVGQHRPEWWLVARHGERDVGCLLLADHPEQEQVEIVYLGIAPEFRGRGWGLALTRQAQWLAREAGRARVVLAVDAANHPAIAAYESAGFKAWDRRWLFVRDFGRAAKPAAAST